MQRLNTELLRIVQTPAIKAQLRDAGVEVLAMSPLETTQYIARDRGRWAKVIQQSGGAIEGAG